MIDKTIPSFKLDKKRLFFYGLTLAAIVLIIINIDELHEIKNIFTSANGFWLFAAAGSQLIFYIFVALNYKFVLKLKDADVVPFKELVPMSLVVQFFNQVLPSASLSGNAFFVYFLRKYNVPIAEGIGRAILEFMTMYMAFGTYVGMSIVMIAREGLFAHYPEVFILIYIFFALVFLLVIVFLILQHKPLTESRPVQWLAEKFTKTVEKYGNSENKNIQNAAGHAQHVKSFFQQLKSSVNLQDLRKKGDVFWAAYLWQTFAFAAQLFVLYFCAQALGYSLSLEAAFVTFSLARFAAAIVAIPSGIGVFETVAILSLGAFGISAAPAFGIALLSRAFTFWLPMPAGWIVYQHMVDAIQRHVNRPEIEDWNS